MKQFILIPLLAIIFGSFGLQVIFAQSNPTYDECIANSGLLGRDICEEFRETPDASGPPPAGSVTDGSGPPPAGSVTQGTDSKRLTNPLRGDLTTIDELFVAILEILVIVLTPIVVIFIILSGFKYVTAQGDPGKLEEAKRALLYAIIGGVLIIGAQVIAEIIAGTIRSFQ